MNPLAKSLGRIAGDLEQRGQRFAVVGGLAVSARAEPRLTRDADLVVAAADDASVERLIRDLRAGGYQTDLLVEQEATGRIATVRLTHPLDGGLVVDLLFASSGIEDEIVAHAEELQLTAELALPVASAGHLIATKLLARDDRHRPADADDLRALAEVADDRDWALAQQAVALIAERGYSRGRDLETALQELRSSGAY